MKAAIFGAGNIGRGLVGEVLLDSGYELTFIDADASIVDMLETEGSYEIDSGSASRSVPVSAAINAADEPAVHAAVAQANVVATAVGPAVLKIVAPAIGAGLLERSPERVNVIACENVHPNSEALRDHIVAACGDAATAGAGFPNVVVDRIAPGAPGSSVVKVEEGFEFVVDSGGWVGPMPAGPIVFSSNLAAYKLRKLWMVNGLHFATAVLGLRRGYEHIHNAMADEEVRNVIADVGSAMARGLAAQTSEFSTENLDTYRARSLARFMNAELPDQNKRVARNPLAKLAAGERIMAPAKQAAERGDDTAAFADVVAGALTLTDPEVEGVDQLRAELAERGVSQLLADHCGVDPDSGLYEQIETRMSELETKRGVNLITEEILITNPSGLHARPAAEIVEAAKTSDAEIHIHKGEKAANAKSIMSVLALGANTGDTVKLTVEGDDADDVVAKLKSIMQSEEH